jgi:hypothetical protein
MSGDFRPIDTAPRDGSVIEVMSDDGFGPFEMLWNPAGHNPLVSTEDDGLWECPGGNFTWCEDAGMGPTHWRPVASRERRQA